MMVFAYNKNMGLQEYDSRDEAKERIQTKQLILKDGVTYVKLVETQGMMYNDDIDYGKVATFFFIVLSFGWTITFFG